MDENSFKQIDTRRTSRYKIKPKKDEKLFEQPSSKKAALDDEPSL